MIKVKQIIYTSLLLIIPWIYAEAKLKIGTDDWKPYEYKESGIVTGFSTEIVRIILHKMNADFGKIEIYPWIRGEKMLFEGSLDILFCASPSTKRKQYAYFSNTSLTESIWILFIRKNDQGKLTFKSLNDLKGKKIGVVSGYAYTNEFWNFLKENKSYEAVATDEINFKKLINGRVHYIACEYGNASAIIKKTGISSEVTALTGHPIKKTGLFVMFSKKTMSENFVSDFSGILKKFKTTKEYKNIRKKYFE